jgi:hypothetical protein
MRRQSLLRIVGVTPLRQCSGVTPEGVADCPWAAHHVAMRVLTVRLAVLGSSLALILLAGCGSKAASGQPYSVHDVTRAFSQQGIRLQQGPTPSAKHARRLAVFTPPSGPDAGINMVIVDDRPVLARLSAASFNTTASGGAHDEQVGNVEVVLDGEDAAAARAAIRSLRAKH